MGQQFKANAQFAQLAPQGLQSLLKNRVVVKCKLRNIVGIVPKNPGRKTRSRKVKVRHLDERKIGHRNDPGGRILADVAKPGQVFRVLYSAGVAEGSALLQIKTTEAGELPKHSGCGLVEVLVAHEVVARQGQAANLAKVFLLNEQHVEFLAIKTKNSAVYRNIGVLHWSQMYF